MIHELRYYESMNYLGSYYDSDRKKCTTKKYDYNNSMGVGG